MSEDKKLTLNKIFSLAVKNHQKNNLNEAKNFYNKVLEIKNNHENAINNLGVIYLALKDYPKAKKYFEKAIQINTNYTDANLNLGITFLKLNEYQKAKFYLKKIIRMNSANTNALNILGKIYIDTRENLKAKDLYNKIIEIDSNHIEANNNLGFIFIQIGDNERAKKYLKKTIELKPDFAEAYNNLGIVYKNLNKLDKAETCYKKSIKLKSNYAEAHFNLADVQKLLQKIDEAIESYSYAKSLNPDLYYLLGSLLHLKMYQCSWDEVSKYLDEIVYKTNDKKKISTPFPLLSLIDDPSILKKSAEIFSNHKFPKSNIFPEISHYKNHKKIRIGYFSPDFYNHPISHLTSELYEIHNREKFEIHAFMLSKEIKDEFNTRIKNGVDHFHDVGMFSDFDIVSLARHLELDIAIDLAGYTAKSKPGIFAMSLAPIQISYIGFLGTMGTDYIDYLIADKTIISKNNRKYFSENIIYLPNYQVNDSKNYTKNIISCRKDFDIPENVFVFCCLNNIYKLTPKVFNSWARILKKVDGSVLLLYVENKIAIKNLKNLINDKGINPNRLIFTKKLERSKYLARYKIVDLFLDTLPYNGGATISDALRMGLPVITCMGESFASRQAASILKSINLPELITTTLDEYETLAINLASDSKKLKLIKKDLNNNLSTKSLYDTHSFTKNLESAYQIIYEKNQKGISKDDIEIKDQKRKII